jgi:hypothetical protein
MRASLVLALLTLAGPLPAHADTDVYQPLTLPGAVAVYRGSAVRPAYLARSARVAPAAEAIDGRNIWLVYRDQGELTGCRAVNTTVIGQRRIGCTTGRLPD